MKPHLPLPSRGRKKNSERKSVRRRRVDIQRTGLAVATALILSFLLCIHLLPDKVTLAPGDIAPADIRAHRSVRYSDSYEFRKQQAEAASSVSKVYDYVPTALNQSLRDTSALFDAISSSRSTQGLSAESRAAQARAQIRNRVGINVPLQPILTLVLAPDKVFNHARDVTITLVRKSMSGEVKDDVSEISKIQSHVSSAAEVSLGSTRYAAAVSDMARLVIRPNMIFDFEKTANDRERALENVKPVYKDIRTGELVIAKGEVVTRQHIEKFTALGLRQRRVDYRTIFSITAFVSFLVGLVIIYLARYQPSIYKTTRLLVMLSLVVVVSILGLKVGGGLLGITSGVQLAYIGMMFTTTAAMVLAVLLNPQIAVMIVAVLSIAAGLVTNYEMRYAASTLLSGLVAIYAVANIRGIGDLMRALGAIAITNVVLVWIMGGLLGDSAVDMMSSSVWAILLVALPATSLFWYITWLLERPFKVTTHISLLELADTNKPILKRLVVEAPGTYTHSMAVGNLAEAAAEAIGADGLFAKVASYYHDIGKIKRPHFFVENQSIENAHDRLNPTLSGLVITSHIKDGLEVAREFKLPPSIQDIISQHHGTSLVQYFFNQATEQIEPSPLLEQQFRYEGPKPQSKEAAIIMLADSVEAASRSLAKPTIPLLESLVEKIIADKLGDGQLDESELTFRDIGIVRDAFIHTLAGTLHARIEYQNSVSSENGKVTANGNSDQELAGASGKTEEAD